MIVFKYGITKFYIYNKIKTNKLRKTPSGREYDDCDMYSYLFLCLNPKNKEKAAKFCQIFVLKRSFGYI